DRRIGERPARGPTGGGPVGRACTWHREAPSTATLSGPARRRGGTDRSAIHGVSACATGLPVTGAPAVGFLLERGWPGTIPQDRVVPTLWRLFPGGLPHGGRAPRPARSGLV